MLLTFKTNVRVPGKKYLETRTTTVVAKYDDDFHEIIDSIFSEKTLKYLEEMGLAVETFFLYEETGYHKYSEQTGRYVLEDSEQEWYRSVWPRQKSPKKPVSRHLYWPEAQADTSSHEPPIGLTPKEFSKLVNIPYREFDKFNGPKLTEYKGSQFIIPYSIYRWSGGGSTYFYDRGNLKNFPDYKSPSYRDNQALYASITSKSPPGIHLREFCQRYTVPFTRWKQLYKSYAVPILLKHHEYYVTEYEEKRWRHLMGPERLELLESYGFNALWPQEDRIMRIKPPPACIEVKR